jgi:UDP-hydrolysing UDP-N-acetyl-D-glucosamine 2-epimerase
MRKRTIGVVTVARSDYGIYFPLLRAIQADPELELHLIVSGMHLSPEFGLTFKNIEADGFRINERVEMLLSSDTPEGVAKSMGLGTVGFAQAFSRLRPDILVVLGDRFEMHAAATAAVPFLLPIAHIAGGAVTMGAIDDVFRHSIAKMSHLHFTETEIYARRILQMGEEPWRVVVTGALALDSVRDSALLSGEDLEIRYGLSLDESPLLVTFHPVTREYQQTENYMAELLAALTAFNLPIVFTYPNADTNSRVIIRMIEDFVSNNPRAQVLKNLGSTGYLSLMKNAAAMIGNSSSGIVEAPSFKLPVVNIGNRQEGRLKARNVIDVGYTQGEIRRGIDLALSPGFRQSLEEIENPYGDGKASHRIIEVLKEVNLGDRLILKKFIHH